MLRTLITIGISFMVALVLSAEESILEKLESADLQSLELRLEKIDHQLDELAQPSLRGGIGAIGYRSSSHIDGNHTEWIKINLSKQHTINEVVLVPILYRDSKLGFEAEAFPISFRILAGTENDKTGKVIAEYASTENLLPRVAPMVISIQEETTASWIKVEATQLGTRSFDGRHIFQLSEILVFSGDTNVALRQPIDVSSTHKERMEKAWGSRYLTDGNLPYLMDGALGKKSIAYVSQPAKNPSLTVDLTEEKIISGINLHSVEQSDTVPQAHSGNFGIPLHLKVEASTRADFSDAVEVLNYKFESNDDVGPFMMWNLPKTNCRYVRITDANPQKDIFQIGFAEIEILSQGRNVALDKPIGGTRTLRPSTRSFGVLTDGNNLYGEILPLRQWMNQLKLRHDLETERPLVIAELNSRYAQQQGNLKLATWFIALLLVGGIILVLIQKAAKQRTIYETRERIAANLHDELGANLHAIGLFGNLAKQEVEEKNSDKKWTKLTQYTDAVCALTTETGTTAKHCTNLLAAKDIYADLPGEMKRLADRFLADMDHTLNIADEEITKTLSPRRRNGLFRFYKECLTNILRHSDATKVNTELSAHSGKIRLTVTDNGSGISDMQTPASLKRRARLLGAKVSIESPSEAGSRITLLIKPRKFFNLS